MISADFESPILSCECPIVVSYIKILEDNYDESEELMVWFTVSVGIRGRERYVDSQETNFPATDKASGYSIV